MVFLDRSGRRFDALARRQFIRQGFELKLGLGEKAFAESEQALRVVVEEVFLLQEQIEMLFAHRVAAVATRQKMAFEKVAKSFIAILGFGDGAVQRGAVFDCRFALSDVPAGCRER